MLHYDPQHVSSSTLLILRRTNCITTASGVVTLCKQPYSMQVQSGLQSALSLHTVRLFTEGDDTRGCCDTICPPEDEHRGELSYLAPLGSENISAPYFKQCFFRRGVLPPRLSQTPRLAVPRQVYSYVYKRKKTKCKYLFN